MNMLEMSSDHKSYKQLKKLDPNIIRVGDRVMIANPTLFIRCGYPLSKAEMVKEVNGHFGEIIDDLIYSATSGNIFTKKHHAFAPIPPIKDLFAEDIPKHVGKNTRDKIVEELASCRIFARKFGGSDRTLHTKHCPELRGRIFQVAKIKFVTTGKYWPSRGNISDWEDDYEPPCLSEQKVHKILTLYPDSYFPFTKNKTMKIITPSTIDREADFNSELAKKSGLGSWNRMNYCDKADTQIEAIHVEKLADEREVIQDNEGNWIKNPHFGLPKSKKIFKMENKNEDI